MLTPRDILEGGCDLIDAGQFRQAADCFLKAARGGVPEAKVNLGVLYSEGKGVRRNARIAAHWYKSAARQGTSAGAANLALDYLAAKRYRWARYWFYKAIDLGDCDALVELAKMNMRELGTRLPGESARKLFTMALKAQRPRITGASLEEARALLGELELAKKHA
jgi:TPR repeat protein